MSSDRDVPSVEASPRELVVADTHAGERLDRFAARALDVPRGYAQRLCERGILRLEGRTAAKGAVLTPGMRITVLRFRHPREGPTPEPDLDLAILAEHAGLVAVDKPAGQPTHPLDYDETGTLVNAMLGRWPRMRTVGEGGLVCGVVHRLDVGTSGVQLFATSQSAWERARNAFVRHRVDKRYLARVHGCIEREAGIELRLESRGARMRVVPSGGHVARTHIRPLQSDGATTLVEARIPTGVRHQIRVSLAWLGHPIVGDTLYGSTLALARFWLHAESITLEGFEARAPIPRELEDWPPTAEPGEAAPSAPRPVRPAPRSESPE